jgi:hypothetical protein
MAEDLDSLLLTRSEAAKYKGLAGEQSVRDAESRGALISVGEDAGRAMYRKTDLDAWQVKGKEPSAAQKKTVLRNAARAREQEAREHPRKQQAAGVRFEAESIAHYYKSQQAAEAADQAKRNAVSVLERQVVEDNRRELEVFHVQNVSEVQTLGVLGRDGFREARREGLKEVEVPCAWHVRRRHIDSVPPRAQRDESEPIVSGKFYRREEVVAFAERFAMEAERLEGRLQRARKEGDPATNLLKLMTGAAIGGGITYGVTKARAGEETTEVTAKIREAEAKARAEERAKADARILELEERLRRVLGSGGSE